MDTSTPKIVNNTIKDPMADKVYYTISYVLLSIILVIVLYPVYFILVAAVSDPVFVNSGEPLLFPKGFTLVGYEKVFADQRIWAGYFNTILYAVLGTLVGLFVSLLAGFSLSRQDMPYSGWIMAFFVFTMYFNGGLIPNYLVIQNIGLMNTRALMVILGTTTVYNIILIRSYFASSLPNDLYESATIDGCSIQRFFVSIALPLAKPIVAVIALYIAVSQWNAYFNPMLYLSDRSLFPLQLILRELLDSISNSASTSTDPAALEALTKMAEVIKYGVIVVSTLPIICVYPFIQKYFVKGVMIGALKG